MPHESPQQEQGAVWKLLYTLQDNYGPGYQWEQDGLRPQSGRVVG